MDLTVSCFTLFWTAPGRAHIGSVGEIVGILWKNEETPADSRPNRGNYEKSMCT
jgi:hypothetical protein